MRKKLLRATEALAVQEAPGIIFAFHVVDPDATCLMVKTGTISVPRN